MPRNIPINEELPLHTPVHIEDPLDGIMTIPNGKVMVWIAGKRSDPPYEYWNMLRDRAGIINTVEFEENYEETMIDGVPETIRQIAQEIGGMI